MSDEENNEKSFKVKDKRRFDSEGNPREEGEEQNTREAPISDDSSQSVKADVESTASKSGAGEGAQDFTIDFSSFVMSLATQALMQLGEMPGPEGMEIPVNPAAAKQTIDIIAMLEQKTKGNLESEEDRLVEEILHTLRMSFLNKSK